jgi:hypothetical protein
MDTEKEIKKIQGYKTWSPKRKVDALLEMDANLRTNLGIDSTAAENKKVKVLGKKIYKAISAISPIDGYLLRAHMDELEAKI